MVRENVKICPKCGGTLEYRDNLHRIVRTRRGVTNWVQIRRLRCTQCGVIHRELPNYILPYKQYEAETVQGVIEGLITPETLGFEDYPCEMTMIRWKTHILQLL